MLSCLINVYLGKLDMQIKYIDICCKVFLSVIMILYFSLTALAQTATNTEVTPPQRVSGKIISSLIRSTMIAVNHANQTGNYTVLRDLGSRSFRNGRTAADLSGLFNAMRTRKKDLGSTILVDPKILGGPKLTTDGKLTLVGFFETQPENVTFELVFLYEVSAWRIAAVSIGFRPYANVVGNAPEQENIPKSKKRVVARRDLPNVPVPIKKPFN